MGSAGPRGRNMRGKEHGVAEVKANVPITDQMGVLAGGIRLELLVCLADSPKDVSTVADELGLAVNHVSHGLRLLREHGLVNVTQRRKHRIHGLSPNIRIARDEGIVQLAVTDARGGVLLMRIPPSRAPRPPRIDADESALLKLGQLCLQSSAS